jgi:hypothetical protein
MSPLSLVLVVVLVLLVVALSPRVAAWVSRDASREGLRTELEALERKKEMLRQAKQPPAA